MNIDSCTTNHIEDYFVATTIKIPGRHPSEGYLNSPFLTIQLKTNLHVFQQDGVFNPNYGVATTPGYRSAVLAVCSKNHLDRFKNGLAFGLYGDEDPVSLNALSVTP